MGLFEQNRAYFANQRANTEWTKLGIWLTGRIDPDTGLLIDSPTEDLPPGRIWLHSEYGRMNTSAIIGQVRSDLAGARVVSGINQQGERVAIRPAFDDENVAIWGDNLAGLSVPTMPGASSNTPLPTRLLMGGRVLQASASPGLTVFVEALPEAGLTDDDSAHDLSADVPATTGLCWSVLFIDANGLVYSTPTTIEPDAFSVDNLDVQTALNWPLPDNVYPLFAISLYNGQTDILYTNSRFEDIRRVFNVTGADTPGWSMTHDITLPAGHDYTVVGTVNTNAYTLTANGYLTVLG